MQFSWKNPLKALPVLLLLAAYAGAAFGAAGNVQFVIGDVKLITKTGVTRALQKGAEINEGDKVITAADTADVQAATLAFGVGNWYVVRGDTARARPWFERSIRSGGWPGFGFIVSEIELRRLR